MQIENVPISKMARTTESFRKELIQTMRNMEPGQSVVIDKCDSNTRTMVWVANQVMERRYGIRKLPDGKFRVGRVE